MTQLYAVSNADGEPLAAFSTLAMAKNATEKKILADMVKGYYGKDVAKQAPELIWRAHGEVWQCGFIRDTNAYGYAAGWRVCDDEINTLRIDPEEL